MYLNQINLSYYSKDCNKWKTNSNYQIRYEFKNNLHVCSVHGKIGIDQNNPDEVSGLVAQL